MAMALRPAAPAPRRSARDTARRRSRSARGRRRPRSRWTPARVVAGFADVGSVDTSPCGRFWRPARGRPPRRGPQCRRPSGRRRRSPAGRPSPLRCAAATSPERPSATNLLLLLVAQDVAHGGARDHSPSLRQRLGRHSVWPVFRCPLMAGFGCPPRGVFRILRPIASSVRSTRLQPSVSRPRTLRLGALAQESISRLRKSSSTAWDAATH